MYKIYNTEFGSIIIVESENKITSIPMDERNADYQDYLKWVAEGNTAEEYQPN